jgi:hypothetical protein
MNIRNYTFDEFVEREKEFHGYPEIPIISTMLIKT